MMQRLKQPDAFLIGFAAPILALFGILMVSLNQVFVGAFGHGMTGNLFFVAPLAAFFFVNAIFIAPLLNIVISLYMRSKIGLNLFQKIVLLFNGVWFVIWCTILLWLR